MLIQLLLLLLGVCGIFIVPWYFPPQELCKSESYSFGFNNRVALIALLIVFLITVFVRFFFSSARPARNYLDWIRATPIPFFFSEETKKEYFLLGLFALGITVEILCMNHLLRIPYWGEATYFLRRIDFGALDFSPYRDFEYLYGPLLLYGPLVLDQLSFRLLGIENAYALFLLLTYFLGAFFFLCYTHLFSLTQKGRCTLLLFFYLFWVPICMGLNYTPLRFAMMLGVIAFVHAIFSKDYFYKKSQWYFLGIFLLIAGSVFLTIAISPEIGFVTAISLVAYGGVLWKQCRTWQGICIFLGACGGVIFAFLLFPGFLGGMSLYLSGGSNFPIYPNFPNLLLLVGIVFLLPLFAVAFLKNLTDQRAPLAAALITGALGMLPAVLGRCDPGHVVLNGLLLLTLFFPAAFCAGHKSWRMCLLVFSLLLGLLYFSYWNHYAGLLKRAFSESAFYRAHKNELVEWQASWLERKTKSAHGNLLNWKKTISYPNKIEFLDRLGKVAMPFPMSLSIERFLKLQDNYTPCYFDDLNSPREVKVLLDALLKYDAILLPKDALQYRNYRPVLSNHVSVKDNTSDKKYEQQKQHFLSVLMCYPVHSPLIRTPYDPVADLISQLLFQSDVIGSFSKGIIVKPNAEAKFKSMKP